MHTKTQLQSRTHTQANSEFSGYHAMYLHSGFKETVSKAVVDGDLARCSPEGGGVGGRRKTEKLR